jgi:hypothetical protein
LGYTWPGNIREVQNAIERALIMSEGGQITAAQLGLQSQATHPSGAAADASGPSGPPALAGSLPEMEERLVREALQHAKGNKTQAAKRLGLSRIQLYTRLKRFGISSRRSPATSIRNDSTFIRIFSRIEITSLPVQPATATSSSTTGLGPAVPCPSVTAVGPPGIPPSNSIPWRQTTVACFISCGIISPW